MTTVTISLSDVIGEAVACEVVFTPASTPIANGANLIVSGERSVSTDDNGNGQIELKAGKYSVSFNGISGNQDALTVIVPDVSYPVSIIGIITDGSAQAPDPAYPPPDQVATKDYVAAQSIYTTPNGTKVRFVVNDDFTVTPTVIP